MFIMKLYTESIVENESVVLTSWIRYIFHLQLETVKTLIKQKADLNALDNEGNKPSALTGSNEIKALLLKRERKTNRDSESSELDVKDDDDAEDEDDGLQGGDIIRINSKTV